MLRAMVVLTVIAVFVATVFLASDELPHDAEQEPGPSTPLAAADHPSSSVPPIPTREPYDPREFDDADRDFTQQVAALVMEADWQAIESLVDLTLRPCSTNPSEWRAPECADEPHTTLSFMYGYCRVAWHETNGLWERGRIVTGVSKSAISGAAGAALRSDGKLYAVVVAGPSAPDVDYYIAFSHHVEYVLEPTGFFFAVRDRRIVGVFRACIEFGRDFGPEPTYLIPPPEDT